jgi:hypothetical protein
MTSACLCILAAQIVSELLLRVAFEKMSGHGVLNLAEAAVKEIALNLRFATSTYV